MKSIFEGKDILVTGGCGSIGTELVKQLIEFNPKRVRVYDNNETGHFYLNQKIQDKRIRNLIGDIRDKDRLTRALEDVDIVFHAAALKHVPFCEYNPFEAVNTNVIGTQNLVSSAIEKNVKKVIGISTDKSVNPVNTMGATKLLSEKIISGAPVGENKTKFAAVRFGNVLDSVGSVIPIFKEQIKNKEYVTITSKKMTRFFMSMSDAVNFVLNVTRKIKGGEIYILKMKAIRIIDLAEVLVEELAPRYNKNSKKFEYKIIGIRPGEKLHESLYSIEESPYIKENDDMFILHNSLINRKANFNKEMSELCSKNTEFLSKEEIKNKLYDQKII